MCLTFTALEVGSGDAFLLEDGERKILFDSGGSKTKIVGLLKTKGIKRIDLAVCSHNDKDHSNGFLGLLNSEVEIDEIWLPGTWASIIHFLPPFIYHEFKYCDNRHCWYDYWLALSQSWRKDEEAYKAIYNELLSSEEVISNDQLRDDTSLIIALLEDGYWRYCSYSENKELATKLPIQLDTIIKIAEVAFKKHVRIRWFEPTDVCTKKGIDNNIILLNAVELARARRIKNPHELMLALFITMENKYSLAMEYLHNGNPVVRFSADSDSTCQSQTPYNNNIIITAPHHGSGKNANVYNIIKGNDIIWVRSDSKTGKRPCADFKSQTNKLCIACHTLKKKTEICFEYDYINKKWNKITGTCCKC